MSSKSKTTSTATHGYYTPPPTQATTNLQSMVDTPTDYSTPIRNAYGRAEQQTNRSYNNPLGAYTTQDVRDKSVREMKQTMGQNLGLDLSNAAQQSASDKFTRQSTVAGLTQPNFAQTGGTQVSQQPFNWMGLIQAGAGVGSAALA